MAEGRHRHYLHLPPTLVISLEEGERRDRFRVECGMHLPNGYEILEAVDTRHLGNGHIGCALSHRRAIEIARERDWDEVLVLEDDAVPSVDRACALTVLPRVPADAEMVFLGGHRNQDYLSEPSGVDGLVRLRGGLTTTHAVIYRRPVYDAVLDYIPPCVEAVLEVWGVGDPVSYAHAIDQEYQRWQRDPSRAIYAVATPWAFVGNWSHSEPLTNANRFKVERGCVPTATRMLVSRLHQFATPLIDGNAADELAGAVALTEPTVALRLGRGSSLRDAMGGFPGGGWWADPKQVHRAGFDHFCKFLVWQHPADRLRRLYWCLSEGNPLGPRWRSISKDKEGAPRKLDRRFEALVDTEMSFRSGSSIDERLRPQRFTFDRVPLNLIVPLDRLDQFLRERFGFAVSIDRSVPELSPAMESCVEELVSDYYQADLEIPEAGVPVFGGPVAASSLSTRRAAVSGRVAESGKLPEFLIVGAMKSGTTSLLSLVSQHPDIEPPSRKEVHFFDRRFHRGVEWYRRRFSGSSRQTGEATPSYLFHPLAAARIREVLPDVKLLAILRNPIDRAISHYRHSRRRAENLGLRQALDMEEERVAAAFRDWERGAAEATFAQRYSYRRRGLYAEQLERYFELFGREQVLVLGFEEFFADIGRGLKEVYSFLDVASDFRPADERPRHVSPNTGEVVPDDLREELREYFAPHNDRLFELLGRRFDW